jgi:uncharacterized membrane protein
VKVTTFSIKIWRWFSILLVVGGLAWTYSLLPDLVAVGFASSGIAENYLPKDTIFYITMGLIVFNNVVIAAMAKAIGKVPASLLPIPNRHVWAGQREELNEHLVNWLYCLVAAINTIVALSLFALGTVNSNQFNQDVFSFAWLFYLGFGMLILIFVSLPLRLLRAPAPEISLD